ncbi:hypothetical protein [Methylobacterium sp. J-068]|uniref:hypothetical protein n=1 Tax=Methylobacterium sp. J-068 TaxID=2836649 RepID=UPI001FB9989E|nr:hypothetical protein [Methylobacterium sp. J-068]MCJ2036923.1 hypothetical protein [Methylobacterium sp. J-068]
MILPGAASAADRQAFETVKGWEIERTVGSTSPNACLMSHTYKDKEDDNAVNAVIFALNGSEAVLVLVYEKWGWDKDEKVKAPMFLDKNRYAAKSAWVGDAETLTAAFPDSIVPNLMAAKTIVLQFDNGKADFNIGGFAEGYESLRRCNATKVAAPMAAAPQSPVAPAPAPKATAPAATGAYSVMTIGGTGPDFVGCLAHSESLGLGLVGVGQNLALIANTPKFPFDKGVAVQGTWAVDNGSAMPFTTKTDTAHTVTIDIPHDPAAVQSLTSGQSVTIQANGTQVPFALGPMKQAFADLSTCMETKKAP